jgi:hypothetical protein
MKLIGQPIYNLNNNNICWNSLSRNSNAIHLLEKNLDKIDWNELSFNPNAIHLFEKYPEKINWLFLSTNSNAIHLLNRYINNIYSKFGYFYIIKYNWKDILSTQSCIIIYDSIKDTIYENTKYIITQFIRYTFFVICGTIIKYYNTNKIKNMTFINLKNMLKGYCVGILISPFWLWLSYFQFIEHLWYEYNVSWHHLSINPNAISILEKYPNLIVWRQLSRNANAIHLLEKNLSKVDWNELSINPNAIHLLEKYPEKINWHRLSMNSNAIYLLENNLDKINWEWLSSNPNAIHLLNKNLDKIDWYWLSLNPNANPILEKNLDKIDWHMLSKNPNAITILENNLDKIHWRVLSENPNAIHLLANLDYENMKENIKEFNQELIEYVFNPNRLLRLCKLYDLSFDEINELY